MKRVVVSSGLHEDEIRPPSLMSEFKRLSIQDAVEYFGTPASRVAVACPACGSEAGEPSFDRYTFLYNTCATCKSLYVSPRPSEEGLREYYAHASASRFRATHFSRDTARARRYHLLISHANWMAQMIDEQGCGTTRSYADVSTYSPEIFEEMARQEVCDSYYSIEPLLAPEPAISTPVRIVTFDEAPPLGAVSAFEKLEHQFSPLDLLRCIKEKLAPGGLLFFTTRTISGFDLQVLWDKTPYIFAPEHLNLLSIEGLRILADRADLELLELSTPGQLDLQLVDDARKQDPAIRLPRFVRSLLDERDELAHEDFQAFLQKHRLSSHVRVAVRKKDPAP